ncbi:adenylate cyclase type 10-like [Hypomesus transpacificus]|uniref:adenylate cyclase type 10-like n=1 Tax=Hypomesus transpacificus TaxID=137520 RepID=UPI001F0742C5|nr:adenylate cyclase type 10-like [Hypomesus transpacificus]
MDINNSKRSHKITSIASHVPDLVVYSTIKQLPYAENFQGVLLFADVSGFTNLTEKFSQSCKKGYGADELTRTLNSYIGDIVSHILDAGGDILNYAGDAILALWAVELKRLSDVISLVVKCSLVIQDKCGVRKTGVGCQLRVKIGISAGKLSKVIVGDDVSQYFVVIGRAVDEVRLAEGLAVASSIILSPNAWEQCNRDDILVDKIENERAVRVRYLKQDPKFPVDEYKASMGTDLQYEDPTEGCVRKACRLLPNPELESCLRKYVIETVLQKIDANQPLEYLSEMRPATIVFVNLQFQGRESDAELCSAMQLAALGIARLVTRRHGRVNKVFMFDKGCTYLCLFGLPGDKREDESAQALQAAYGVYQLLLQKLSCLRTVSVGVTTGPVFCGVVGHPVRHEYTVIGRKVNLAARLMMYYPGLVTCDQETCHYSKLPQMYFSKLPEKPMKGVEHPGSVYQFVARRDQINVGKAAISVLREEGYPLLGRSPEMEVYSSTVSSYLEARMDAHMDYTNIVIFEGAAGYGKSRLLAEIVYRATKEGMRVVSLELSKVDLKESCYTLRLLLARLLGLQDCKSYATRERAILDHITEPDMRHNLCLLNSILLVKFPISRAVSLLGHKEKRRETANYFIKLLCQFAEQQPCVFVLDEAHYVDCASWSVLLQLQLQAHVLLFLSTLPSSTAQPSSTLASLAGLPRSRCLRLAPLEPLVITQLACQMLGVDLIPSQVEVFLVERSHGVPFYCEELLRSLYQSHMIGLRRREEDQEDPCLLLFPSEAMPRSQSSSVWGHAHTSVWGHAHTSVWGHAHTTPAPPGAAGVDKSISRNGRTFLFGQPVIKKPSTIRKIKCLDKSQKKPQYVCCVREDAKFHDFPIPLTLKGMALAHLDHLRPTEQMVVKCAAVIGHTFTTHILTSIMPEGSEATLGASLALLFQSGTLECGSKPRQRQCRQAGEAGRWGELSCFCEHNNQDVHTDGVRLAFGGGVWCCQVMRFCTVLVKDTACELWLREQKKELHARCARYLQQQPHSCPSCRHAHFIYGHGAAVGLASGQDEPSSPQQDAAGPTGLPTGLLRNLQGLDGIRGNQVQPLLPDSTEKQFLARLDSMLDEGSSRGQRMRGCSCEQVVQCVLEPIIRHWAGVGDVSRTFYYLLETAAASLYLHDHLRALSYLNEAKAILDNLRCGLPAFETAKPSVRVKICSFEKACVFRLSGEVLYSTGQIGEAEEMFVRALKHLNRRLPRTRLAAALKLTLERLKSRFYASTTFRTPGKKQLARLWEQVSCLSYLWQICCMRSSAKHTLHASLAIAMERNSACLSSQEHKVLFSTIDYFLFCGLRGREGECSRLERLLCGACLQLPGGPEGLLIMSHLVHTLCIVNMCSGDLAGSIQYGYRAQRISMLTCHPEEDREVTSQSGEDRDVTSQSGEDRDVTSQSAVDVGVISQSGVDMQVTAILHIPLLFLQRYKECVQLMQVLEDVGSKSGVSSATGWFYSSCFHTLLYAGFSFRSFERCCRFVEESQSDPNLLLDHSLMADLYSALALWYTRLRDWERARFFYTRVCAIVPQTPASIQSTSGGAMFLESSVLLFRKALMENNKHILLLYHTTQKHFAEFHLKFSSVQMFTPRVLHLKAYLYLLAGHQALARLLLSRGLQLSQEQGNRLEEAWITHSQAEWFGTPPTSPSTWRPSALSMPSWEEAQTMTLEQLSSSHYSFQGLPSRTRPIPRLPPRPEDARMLKDWQAVPEASEKHVTD